jgi:hypothetical protein
MVITGVPDQVPERLVQRVSLDATVPQDPQDHDVAGRTPCEMPLGKAEPG